VKTKAVRGLGQDAVGVSPVETSRTSSGAADGAPDGFKVVTIPDSRSGVDAFCPARELGHSKLVQEVNPASERKCLYKQRSGIKGACEDDVIIPLYCVWAVAVRAQSP